MIAIRKAGVKDLDVVMGLRHEASQWLSATGTDQWRPRESGRMSFDAVRSGLARSITKGDCWVISDGEDIIATLTLDAFADPEFWTETDDPADALYVHRMVVARSHAGRGIGAEMLDWAASQTAATGRQWLRLDAWRTNERLHAYYLAHGFVHVRTVSLPHRGSGALFQRRVA